MASSTLKNAILRHVRIPVSARALTLNPNPTFTISSAVNNLFSRRHLSSSEEARGTFLDKSDVTDRVLTVVKNFDKLDPSKVTPTAHFQKDLGLDSLDTVEIVMSLEEEFHFEIPDAEADKISSINMAVDFISSHPQAR